MWNERGNNEDAISPVIGVMLMLVVTIIIAAIVSGFAGGLIDGSSQKAPTLTMDVKIANTGSWKGSGFSATVTGVSEAIPTSALRIVTSWHATNRTDGSDGAPVTGGSVSVGQIRNTYKAQEASTNLSPPYGFGPGVDGESKVINYAPGQMFGNYTLVQGTGLLAAPSGVDTEDLDAIDGVMGDSAATGYGVSVRYEYTGDGAGNDAATSVLGKGWENLRPGDVVTVNIVHIPSGKAILSREVTVVG